MTKNCKFCGSERKNDNSLRNHERLCKQNPNRQESTGSVNIKKTFEKVQCQFCQEFRTKSNIRKHEKSCVKNPEVIKQREKICPVCNTKFLRNSPDQATCSYSCSNSYFRHSRDAMDGFPRGTQYVEDEIYMERENYRELCFRHHEKKCVVCGEEKVVSVHHIDEDHSNNDPKNLVPLCPTHHQYVHSRFKDEVEPIIENYVAEKFRA